MDGPRVDVDAYASANGCDGDCNLTDDVIPYTFTKRESFGYSLNGKEVVVEQGASLALTVDTTTAVSNGESGYVGSRIAIMEGTNAATGKDYSNRALAKTVDTGWAPRAGATASDILTLRGLHDSLATDFAVPATATAAPSGYQFKLKSDRTDTYVLSLSYQPTGISAQRLASGLSGLATRDAEGNWVNAVAANDGGDGSFVQGPYVHGDTLGTYGIDTATQTAWAVVNHQGDFAVADFAKGSPQLYALIASKAGPAGARVWTLKLVNGHEPVRGARIDDLTLTQTRGTACTPVLVSSAAFQADSAASGTFSDFLGLQSLEVAPLTTVVQAFDLGHQLGIGSYAIPSFASSGTVVSGRLLLTYDLYSRSIDAADFDPDTDLVSSGNVIAADATVPEPATLLLLGLGAFAIPRLRRGS